MNTPLILLILDGWGHTPQDTNNAIAQASTPNWDKLIDQNPHTLVSGSGKDVGLPDGQMGNSEVGHMTIGSGRVIYQDLTRINNAIADESFFDNSVLSKAIKTSKRIHILGLLSPGGVHSHQDHIFNMIKMAADVQVFVHPFLDGRDTPPQSAESSLKELSAIVSQKSNTHIVDIMGRFYAMDRDKRTERTQAATDCLTKGKSDFKATDAIQALQAAYERGETDEFVRPCKITNADGIDTNICDGDTVIFMNFRADRARQLSSALLNAKKINLITLTEYDADMDAEVVFTKPAVNNILSEVIAANNLQQLHIAETEKYAHVTFFFNAGRELPFKGEERILIPSPKVATYDQSPTMSAPAITSAIIKAIKEQQHHVIIANFANADMVGHTGNLEAAIAAIESLDNCIGKITKTLKEYGGQMLITADHGNAEVMWDEQAMQAHTAHTTNLVPLVYVGSLPVKFLTGNFGLQDIAPTMLKLLGLEIPKEMTGKPIFTC